MHGVKQIQMKFIIVKFTFKKSLFPASSFSRWLFSLCYNKIVVKKKRSVTTFDFKKLTWKTATALFDTSFIMRIEDLKMIKKRTNPRREKQRALCNRDPKRSEYC